MAPSALRRLLEIGLAIMSASATLLVMEVAWRFVVFGSSTLSFEQMDGLHPIGLSGMLQTSPYPDVVYELRPGVDQSFKLARFRTSSDGLRDREYSRVKPNGTFRIAVVGDSYSMAPGVPIDSAFHSVLERSFSADRPDRPVEFINFGVGGYSLRHYEAVIRDKVLDFDPDLILLAYCGENDHRIQPPDYAERPFQARERRGSYFSSHLIALARNLIEARRVQTGINQREAAYLDERFRSLAEAARRGDVPLVVAYLEIRPEGAETVARLAEGHGLAWVDASAAFAGTDAAEFAIYYPLDMHPNGRAHAMFADAIGSFLVERELVPP